MLKQEVLGSMRLLQFAGEATRRCNVTAYNCSYTTPTTLKNIVEIMYLSMSGSGVGFSVESKYTDQLPEIPVMKNLRIAISI
jgi:ribonucleoside-diphosphate reductase alpha chain